MLSFSEPAWAHGAVLEYQPRLSYEIRAAYDDGTPMAEAEVAVFAPANLREPYQRGLTDAEGYFLVQPDAPGAWEVQVRQAGHGTVITIPVTATPETAVVTTAYSPVQVGVMIAAVVWGCIGTALYFKRRPHASA